MSLNIILFILLSINFICTIISSSKYQHQINKIKEKNYFLNKKLKNEINNNINFEIKTKNEIYEYIEKIFSSNFGNMFKNEIYDNIYKLFKNNYGIFKNEIYDYINEFFKNNYGDEYKKNFNDYINEFFKNNYGDEYKKKLMIIKLIF